MGDGEGGRGRRWAGYGAVGGIYDDWPTIAGARFLRTAAAGGCGGVEVSGFRFWLYVQGHTWTANWRADVRHQRCPGARDAIIEKWRIFHDIGNMTHI